MLSKAEGSAAARRYCELAPCAAGRMQVAISPHCFACIERPA
jgi:hypothetical protein